MKTDGTIWLVGAELTNGDSSPFRVTSYSACGHQYGCGIKSDSTVWCWNEINNDNDGQLGDGNTGPFQGNAGTLNRYPVQVVTSVGGPALSGITSVNVTDVGMGNGGASLVGGNACALGPSGAVWCWGNGSLGQLGNGSLNDSFVAVPVLSGPGGGQFNGVKQISVTYDHVCALKTDMSVWCWGDNSRGQLGIGDTSLQQALYPVQVTALSNSVSDVVATTWASCATTVDGSAWCWGADWALGVRPTAGSSSYVPVRVQTNATTPLAQVAKIVNMNAFASSVYMTMCALRTDRTLWCWGGTGLYASQLIDYNGTPVANVGITGRACYLDPRGHKWQSVPGPYPVLMTTRELPNYVPAPCP